MTLLPQANNYGATRKIHLITGTCCQSLTRTPVRCAGGIIVDGLAGSVGPECYAQVRVRVSAVIICKVLHFVLGLGRPLLRLHPQLQTNLRPSTLPHRSPTSTSRYLARATPAPLSTGLRLTQSAVRELQRSWPRAWRQAAVQAVLVSLNSSSYYLVSLSSFAVLMHND